jgi:hypothetical protein
MATRAVSVERHGSGRPQGTPAEYLIHVSIPALPVRRSHEATKKAKHYRDMEMTMKYLMLIKHSEDYRSQPIPEGLLSAMGEFVNQGFKSGVLKDTAGLKPTEEGSRVRSSGGKLKVKDGPFTEAKEVIGGYAMVEVKSKEEAREMARQFMELHRLHWPAFEGECEVRPVEDQ